MRFPSLKRGVNGIGSTPSQKLRCALVTAKPLWTDTGIHVNSNDIVSFPAAGTWNGGPEPCGPAGLASGSWDPFLTNVAADFSLIAFVGPNPYYWNGTNEWFYGNTYFPQGASTNGYWPVGNANGVFTNNRAGELWFGFNDDARLQLTNDNSGFVAGYIQITGP
jgi:hypothetical protein